MATRNVMETYNGHVKSPTDAIILFEACRLGLLPRVQRRLSEKERHQIRSGSIFVWDEREAGMRRWTDGKSWSASRVSGSFLTYREMEGKRGANSFTAPVPPAGRDSSGDPDMDGLDGEGPDGYRYKPDGLIKQSFSIKTAQGQHLHLISYFSRADASCTRLKQPSKDNDLCNIRPPKDMYPESSMHDSSSLPAVTRGPMAGSPYAVSPASRAGAPQDYLRHVPPHVHGSPYATPGYPWPPSPMHTPPMPHYSPYIGHPANAQYSPYFDPNRPHPHAAPGAGPTVFDRAPPQTNGSALPPPPPPPQAYHGLPPGHPAATTGHAYQTWSHSPTQRQEPAPYTPQYSGPPQSNGASAYPTPVPAPATQSPYERREEPPSYPQSSQPSSAGTIPSINSLINGPMPNTSPQRNADRRPPSEMVMANSVAPPPPAPVARAGDDKPAFQADKAALRQLDRAFAA